MGGRHKTNIQKNAIMQLTSLHEFGWKSIGLTLSLQKSEGSRAKASKGKAVYLCCEPLATQDLESSGFPPKT